MRKPKIQKQRGTPTTWRGVSTSEAQEQFRKSLAPQDDGANEHVDKFSFVAENILKSGVRSFTFSDVLRECKPFEMDAAEVKALFREWVGTLQRLCKVERIDGCYNEEIYVLNY